MNWFSLLKEVKNITSENLNWFNLPNKLNIIYKNIAQEKPDCEENVKFTWFNLSSEVDKLRDIVNCEQDENGGK